MSRRVSLMVLLFVCVTGLSAISAHAQESTEGTRKVVTRVAPQYPSVAHSIRLSGTVKVEALVSASGAVKSVEVKGGHPLLVLAAQSAIQQWKWEPAPHETREMVEVKFAAE